MRLQKKVLLFWCIISGIYVAIMAWGTLAIQEKYMTHRREREEGKIEALVDQYLVSKKDTLMKIVTSHSYWTEFRNALLGKDTPWIAENTSEYLLDGYDIDMVFTFSEKSKYEKSWGKVSEGDYSSLKNITKVKSEGSELILIDSGIYLICWAPIMDNNQQNPVGTYFIGERVELSELTEFLRIFSFIPVSVEIQEKEGKNENLILPLTDEVDLKIKYQLSEFEEKLKLLFLYMMGGVVLVSLLLFGIFMKYIKGITTKISKVVGSIGLVSNGGYSNSVTLGNSDEAVILADSINRLSRSIREKIAKVEEGYNDSLRLLIKTVEVNDYYTRGHSERVAFFSKALGLAVGYKEIKTLEQGALLHDIGKIATPKSILNKKGKLSDSEYEVVKIHPESGEKILGVVPSFSTIKELVLCHHERVDGSGYPKGLKGDEIPLGARIIAVADVFDAITSDRPYRKALELKEALVIMKKEGEKGLDKKLVGEFLLIAEKVYKREERLRSVTSEKRELQKEVKRLSDEKK